MLLSISEYAKKVGRDPANVRQKILRGSLQAVKIGSQWVIDSETPYDDKREKTGKYKNWRKAAE